jgi:hypothetical protein
VSPRPANASRETIVRALRTARSDSSIARDLGCDRHRVGAIRKSLGLPKVPQQPLTLEEKWQVNTRPLDGGHLEWVGERVGKARTPVLRYREASYSPAAVAFRMRHGRDPQGYVIAECGVRQCVAPDCVEDEAGRQRLREQLRLLLGGPERKTHCVHGHDLAEHGRYSPDGRTAYCEACKAELKRAERASAA